MYLHPHNHSHDRQLGRPHMPSRQKQTLWRILVNCAQNNVLDRSVIGRAKRHSDKTRRWAIYEFGQAIAQKVPAADLTKILDDWRLEQEKVDEQYAALLTGRLVIDARKRDIPVPPEPSGIATSAHWTMRDSIPGWNLTQTGISELKTAIRADRKAEWEPRIAIGTIAVGLLGGATGLVAVIANL